MVSMVVCPWHVNGEGVMTRRSPGVSRGSTRWPKGENDSAVIGSNPEPVHEYLAVVDRWVHLSNGHESSLHVVVAAGPVARRMRRRFYRKRPVSRFSMAPKVRRDAGAEPVRDRV